MIVKKKYNRMYKEFIDNELEEYIGTPEISIDYMLNFIQFYEDSRREMQNYLRSFVFSKVKELKEKIKTDPSLAEELAYYYNLFKILLTIRGIM